MNILVIGVMVVAMMLFAHGGGHHASPRGDQGRGRQDVEAETPHGGCSQGHPSRAEDADSRDDAGEGHEGHRADSISETPAE